ncbi:copper-binding protein [Sulfitobacter sp. SK012]|nr:copper-binding protein [Sulfitobacter sp. SK012]
MVRDAYLRSSTPSSKSGAGFMELINQTGQDDRLIGVRSDLDGMVQLHSHSEDANGVMTMGEIEGGVVIPAGTTHLFARGGDHLMLMGMTAPLDQGQEVPVTLIFETAGEIKVMIPVDSER